MIIELELLAYPFTEELYEKQDNNIPIDFNELEYFSIMFYDISNICPAYNEGYTLITSGGIGYIAKISYENLKKDIRKQKTALNFN